LESQSTFLLRSLLFVPGSGLRMIVKATTLPADAVILDLEDAVAMPDKETARLFVRDSIESLKTSGLTTLVRINALASGLVSEDLEAAISKHTNGIVLPKTESRADVSKIDSLIAEKEKQKGLSEGVTRLIPLLETAKGVLNAAEIADSSKRIIALSFGAVDFSRDMGSTLSKDGTELLYARSRIAICARAAGIPSIDSPWIELQDKEGLVRECRLGRQLGFKGKLMIHPRQIDPVNEVFSPSEKETERASKMVKAFEEASSKGLGAISLDGTMVDIANYRQAKDILTYAKLIQDKKKPSIQ
jgi:citrate lyase subunit beta/citryl-CoA lyase